MTGDTRRLVTPIYIKDRASPPPARDACYFLLTGSGLFIGRNTRFVRSLVPARSWPRELEPQRPRLELAYPKVPAGLLARITGFFWTVACRHGAEAVVLLVLDELQRRLIPVVPFQIATVGRGWNGAPYPVGLHYEIPPLHRRHARLIGDIHSHAFEPAYASKIDVQDEAHRPGLHLVAGRVDEDPPRLHAEYVVDGSRLDVAPSDVVDLDAYRGRATPARRWLSRLRVMSVEDFERLRPHRPGARS